MREDELTSDEQWLYMPRWKKALAIIIVLLMPIVGSIQSISF